MSGVRADDVAATFIEVEKTADGIVYSDCSSKVKVFQSSFIHFHQTVALQAIRHRTGSQVVQSRDPILAQKHSPPLPELT